jgi:hypothetical protein
VTRLASIDILHVMMYKEEISCCLLCGLVERKELNRIGSCLNYYL